MYVPIDSFFNLHQKQHFFEVFSCLVCEIVPLQTPFFPKIFTWILCYRQHYASCDISLERSWGVHFKYIYFYGSKRFHFSYNESYHICFFAKKVCKLTFRWMLPKIVFEFTFFYIHQWIPYKVHVSIFRSSDIPFQKFYFQKIWIFNFCSGQY